jgi:hypothetical protein
VGDISFHPLGFTPDADPVVQVANNGSGLSPILDMDLYYPTERGFRMQQSLQLIANAAPNPVVGAFVAISPAGGVTIYAATAFHIYQIVAGSYVVVDSGGLLPTTGRWYFSQFLGDVIATDSANINPPQISQNGAGFIPLPGSPPQAAINACVDVGGLGAFAFLFNFADGGEPDAWGCSGIGNDTDWNFNIQTLGATARLATQPGPVTGASQLNAYMVAFKQRSIFLGQFLGGQFSWDFQIADSARGCASHEAIVNLGNVLAFPSTDNFYTFDGSNVTPIPNLLRDWFFRTLNVNYYSNMISDYDIQNSVVYWYFSSVNANPAGTRDTWIAWHTLTNRWTKGQLIVQAALSQVPPTFGLTWGEFGQQYLYPTYGSVPTGLQWGSSSFNGSTIENRAVFLGDSTLRGFTGPPSGRAWVKTGDHGTEERLTFMNRVRPRYAVAPTPPMPAGPKARCTTYVKDELGDQANDDDGIEKWNVALSGRGWFDFRESARYHRLVMEAYRDHEILGYAVQTEDAGEN